MKYKIIKIMIFKKYNEKNNIIKTIKNNKKIDLKFFQKPIRNSMQLIGEVFIKINKNITNNKVNLNFIKLKKNDALFFLNLNKKKIF